MHDRDVGNKINSLVVDRNNCSQDELANFIENSLDDIYILREESFKPITEEEVYNVDINKHRFKVIDKHKKTQVTSYCLEEFFSSDGLGLGGYGLNLI